MASLLRIANIEKSYTITKTQKQEVLKGIDAEFDRGELVALVGESGSGKSTLINLLGGLDQDYTGSVVVKGKFIRDFTEKEMDDYRKKRVGMIFQNYNLISHMTLVENIEIAMQMSDIDSHVRHERALELLRMVGLHEFSHKLPNQLSGGQQQRIAIARALANNPSIILADEPTGALDKESAEIIMQILRKIVESGKLVIVVTHSQTVASHCSRIVSIDDGKIVSDEKKYKIRIQSEYEKVIMPKPIQTKDVAKLSFRNLRQTKSRSILVSIGMSIGIAAIVVILSLSRGLTNYVEDVFADSLASKQMVVTKSNYLSFLDVQIERVNGLEGVEEVIVSSIITDATYTYDSKTASIVQLGGYYSTFYPTILYGSLPMAPGNIIINEALARVISGDSTLISIVGSTIMVSWNDNDYTFKIIGIYEDLSENSTKRNAYVHGNDLKNLFDSEVTQNALLVTVSEVSYLNTIIDDLEQLGYQVYQDDNSASTVLNYISLGTKVLTGISAISMVVAAIMIFIVLYISIVERTKEIGILRAIGAQKKDIKKMFMFEAGMLGFLGGLIGSFFALIIGILTNTITSVSLGASLMSTHILYLFLGVFLSLLVSILAGIAPAIRASNLDPIESLRHE